MFSLVGSLKPGVCLLFLRGKREYLQTEVFTFSTANVGSLHMRNMLGALGLGQHTCSLLLHLCLGKPAALQLEEMAVGHGSTEQSGSLGLFAQYRMKKLQERNWVMNTHAY